MNTMDNAPPFTEQEKRFVLAEAIKTSSVPVERLLSIFQDGSVQPTWNQMLLPHGRNLQSCIDTFQALQPVQPPPPTTFQPYLPKAPPPPKQGSKRKSAPESLEAPSSSSAKRRPSDMSTLHILPKPSNGSPGYNASQPLAPKKRGRPSKATVEQRQADAIARGEVIAPPKVATPKPDTQMGEGVTTPYATIAPMLSPHPAPSPITPSTFESQMHGSPGPDATRKRAKSGPKQAKASKPGESSFSILNPYPEESEVAEHSMAPSSREIAPATTSVRTPGVSLPEATQPLSSQAPSLPAIPQPRTD